MQKILIVHIGLLLTLLGFQPASGQKVEQQKQPDIIWLMAEELYDHTTDSYEWVNEINNPEYAEVAGKLRKQLKERVELTR